MNNETLTKRSAKDGLVLASRNLGSILPPQASRLLYAFQKIQLAMHYADIEGAEYKAWRLSIEALNSLRQIDQPEELPAQIRFSIRRSIDGLLEAVHPFETVPQNAVL